MGSELKWIKAHTSLTWDSGSLCSKFEILCFQTVSRACDEAFINSNEISFKRSIFGGNLWHKTAIIVTKLIIIYIACICTDWKWLRPTENGFTHRTAFESSGRCNVVSFLGALIITKPLVLLLLQQELKFMQFILFSA